jgi:hypothetical protein
MLYTKLQSQLQVFLQKYRVTVNIALDTEEERQ